MADHHRIHRVLGIRKLFCFEEDPKVVQRQIFNRPIPDCKCVELTTEEFVADPRRSYKEAGISDVTGQIVWLDYTRPGDLGKNINEFVSLLRGCEHGDLVRITLNANEKAIKGGKAGLPKSALLGNRLSWIKSQVPQYLPEDARSTDLTESGFPHLLARILRAAAADALGNDVARPLSLVRYADGHQMLAATLLVDKDIEEEPFNLDLLKDWSLVSRSWSTIHQLKIATLTSRERALLSRLVPSLRPEKLARDLPFDPFEGAMSDRQIADHFFKYQDLLRFYPDVMVLE